MVDVERRNWDLLLPYVLFMVHETPQASTRFTPFKLLFGRRLQGFLDMVKEAWEEQPSPFCTTINHVREMQEHIDSVAPSPINISSRLRLNRAEFTTAIHNPRNSSTVTASSC